MIYSDKKMAQVQKVQLESKRRRGFQGVLSWWYIYLYSPRYLGIVFFNLPVSPKRKVQKKNHSQEKIVVITFSDLSQVL